MKSIFVALLTFPLAALAAITMGAPLTGTTTVVNNGPGDQSDPHVSGNLCAYSDAQTNAFTIRYHDLSANTDNGVPQPAGALDFLSDINGNTIAFTRVTSSASSIFTYTVGAASAVEIDPVAHAVRTAAQIGNGVVVWEDHGL